MKDRNVSGKTLVALPLILGIASFFTFVIYYYSANHAPYKYTDIILFGPVFSSVGIIISIITRKSRKQYPALWLSGLLICLLGFMICVCIILLLIAIMVAAFKGEWL
jgi:ABC-type transport system involved in multi-copper enzyme maturation permease subunit